MPTSRSTNARGYGARHQAERARWKQHVEAGNATCARCQQPIDPTEPWDLGHTDDRTTWQGPEHRRCNRSAGGTNGAHTTNSARTTTVRGWW